MRTVNFIGLNKEFRSSFVAYSKCNWDPKKAQRQRKCDYKCLDQNSSLNKLVYKNINSSHKFTNYIEGPSSI